jgi:hypothetical protein
LRAFYLSQSAAVTFLRDAMSTKRGLTDAATLVLISARPRQLLLNTFSSQQVELPSLDIESLRTALDAVAMGRGAVKSGTGVAGSGSVLRDFLRTRIHQNTNIL